jgi:heme/copper-type cytochrome/quinol oxidase subunit 3
VAPELARSPAEPIGRAGLATALLAAGILPLLLAVRGTGRGRRTLSRLWLVVTLGLAGAHLWLLLDVWLHSGLAPASDGRHSAFLGVAGFHGVVAVILLVMIAVSLAWSFARPADARGHATAWNAALVYCFAVASGVIAFAALYLVPRLA